MTGTTIIAETERDRLASVACMDDLDELNCLYLDMLITLDFEMMLSGTDRKWTDGQPIYYDPDDGLAITANLDEEQRADLQKLAKFVRDNPRSDFYEAATF
jgi:hypothetical protein